MLTLYTSNKIDALLYQLSSNIKARPLASPLTPEIIAVNNSAMEKWLQINIAQLLGVESNYHFPLPASLLWSVLKKHKPNLPEQDPLNRAGLQWRIFSALPELIHLDEFSTLKHYIQADIQGIKRWQLAGKIADSFDRYQYYRPDWLEQATGENQWQASLWNAITSDLAHHKLQMVETYLADLQAGNIPTNHLPERISLFAPSALPPLVLNTLLQLAECTEIQVDFYLLAPTNQYWLDLVSEKVAAKTRLNNPDSSVYMETGNRLLSSWGRQGQVFFDQLISVGSAAESIEYFEEPEPHTVLGQVKSDIYHLFDPDINTAKISLSNDSSVLVHSCHSPLREIQVLHNQLLDCLANSPELSPEDILVVAPDISLYAPYIDAVFHKSESKPYIPWNLSDADKTRDIPLIRAFLQLFSLPDSRFEYSEVLAYLDVPEVRQRFNLDDDEIELLREWLDAGAVRWGKDEHHKNKLGLPAISQNTWDQAKDRLFMGYAVGETHELFNGIAPVSQVEGNASEVLGKFWQMYGALALYSKRLAKPQCLADWQIIINQLLDCFFDDNQVDDSYLQSVRDSIDDLLKQNQLGDELISRQLLRLILEKNLEENSNLRAFMSGGVSFSGFKPMRNLPFKVIAVLGLNDGSFPRQGSKTEFDLMQQHYRVSDPNSRDEDRYLFLETLLSAQDTLILSYVGRNIKDNTEKQASVLLKELLDYLDIRFASDKEAPYSQIIIQQHRLQPYHSYYFHPPQSYDSYWCKVASQINTPAEEQDTQWEIEILDAPDAAWREIDVNRLISFFRHPIRYFFQQRLGIYLGDHAEQALDDEPFELDYLEKYLLKARLLNEWLEHRSLKTTQKHLYAEGRLPHGQVADETMQALSDDIEPLLEHASDILHDEKAEPLAIKIRLANTTADDWVISGNIHNIYPSIGLVEIKSGKMQGVDQLAFWIKYLLYRLSTNSDCNQDGYFIDLNETYHVSADSISLEDAESYLQELLNYYWLGVTKPLALLPKSSYEMISKGDKFQGEFSQTWRGEGAFGTPAGDLYDDYIQLALRGMVDLPINTQEFMDVSQMAYQFVGKLKAI